MYPDTSPTDIQATLTLRGLTDPEQRWHWFTVLRGLAQTIHAYHADQRAAHEAALNGANGHG